MVDIRETTIQYPGDGVTLMAYVAAPVTKEKRPAIIIVQEWWGLVEHIKDIARRFAREGYFAIAPDLYSRFGHVVTTDSHEAGAFMNRLAQEDGLKDLQGWVLRAHVALSHIRYQSGGSILRTSAQSRYSVKEVRMSRTVFLWRG